MALTDAERHEVYLGFLGNLAAVAFVAVVLVILRPGRR